MLLERGGCSDSQVSLCKKIEFSSRSDIVRIVGLVGTGRGETSDGTLCADKEKGRQSKTPP